MNVQALTEHAAVLSEALILGCIGCANMGAVIERPWAPYGLLIAPAWVLAVWLARKCLARSGDGNPDRFIPRYVFGISFWLIGIVLVSTPFFGIGGGAIPGMWEWFLFFFFVAIAVLTTLVRLILKRHVRASQAAFLVHALFCAFAVTLIYRGERLKASIEFNVAKLNSPISQVYTVAMPRILSRGREAVPVLIEAAEQCITEQRHQHERDFTIPNVVYCLSYLGGPQAKRCLRDLLTKSDEVDAGESRRWKFAVWLASAQLLESAAREELLALYNHISDESSDASSQRAILLCALAITGDEKAITFVQSHLDELAAEHSYPSQSLTELTTETIRSGAHPRALRSLPWFRLIGFGRPRAPGELSVAEFRTRFLLNCSAEEAAQ